MIAPKGRQFYCVAHDRCTESDWKEWEREKISLQKNNEWFYFLFEFSENEVAIWNKDADASGQPQQQNTEKKRES